MAAPLSSYLQDHLAGASFAVRLVRSLSKQKQCPPAADLATRLLPEIEADREVLERFTTRIGGAPSFVKKAAACVAHTIGRSKLRLTTPLGRFEAIEFL